MAEEMPRSPLTELASAAIQLHELYRAYKDAGFSDDQALYLAACVATGGPKAPPL